MATSRDVQEIVSRLSSSKVKTREEGVKLLSSWLEGERSYSFCRFLGQNTSRLRPNEIPHAETWPFLITLLTNCIALEKAASKKSQPKLIWAKTLRTAIQRAEDPKFSGKRLLLLSVVKLLFNHILDVIKDVPSFLLEYGTILKHLLSVKEYRRHMRMRIYCSLVLLYMKKVEMHLTGEGKIHFNTKDEVRRYILTLNILLENPPGDFPDNIREDVVSSFLEIFSQVREDVQILRKLMECINIYLLKDGPNLGSQALEIHSSLHDFIFRYWLKPCDQGLKDSFILYAKIQLNLTRNTEGVPLIEQLLDVIGKELDQSCTIGGVGMSWSEAGRDDKVGSSASSQQGLMELAASVLYQACANTLKSSGSQKRLKRQDAFDRLKDGLMKGKWLWCGTFCFLVHNYGLRIEESSIAYWFKGICESFERILNDSHNTHSYDGVLWILRGLQELCFVLSRPLSRKNPSPTLEEIRGSWHIIWSCLMHGLPIFSNVTPVADAALVLLGNIVSEDLISKPIVPQEVWELQIFKHMPSLCALYFIACYFSRRGVQGNHHDMLYLRKNLLRAVFQLINSKESLLLNKQIAKVLPAAIFSLCAGYCPFPASSMRPVHVEEWSKIQENDQIVHKFPEYSVEFLSEIDIRGDVEMPGRGNHHCIRLPQEIREQLIHEMEQFFIAIMNFDQEIEKNTVSDLFFFCLFLSNSVYSLSLTRLRNEKSLLFSRMLGCISKLLELIVSTIEERHHELEQHGSLCLMSVSDFSGSALASLRCFIHSPFVCLLGNGGALDHELHDNIVQSIEKVLLVLAKLFVDFSGCASDSLSDWGTRVVDMELDVDDGSKDLDNMNFSGDGISFSPLQWKLEMISAISGFFTVFPVTTWKVMYDLLEKEAEPKVSEYLLLTLCKCFPLSDGILAQLVILMSNMVDSNSSHKVSTVSILSATHGLLESLVSSRNSKNKDNLRQDCRQMVSEQKLSPLGALVNRIAGDGLPDWSARVELIECIYCFILIDPCIGQEMIAGLLALLKDPDYRVRLLLARRIGIVFQTWDGHSELLQDICSSFGFPLVMATKDKVVKAGEVLAAGSQSHQTLETALITLAHLAFYSEKVELEVVFMICAVAAMNPDHRGLIYALVDNISSHLRYSSRMKYLEELLGPLLSRWITCELSLVALVEVQDLFVGKREAKFFLRFCCQWLIPLLIIRQDMANLNLVSTVAGQPLAVLTKKHFVKVFAICMALSCSTNPEKEAGEFVLSRSVLHIAEVSERERDDLIKKYMVSIVGCLLSLSFSSSDPPMPFFSMETIASAIQTVVDGFLEIDGCPTATGIIDKLNIFRPDRVFKFLVDIHYQITAAVHPRHKCHWLAAVEVLIKIIGHRAAVSSTSLYVFSLVGQFIMDPVLEDQCCVIASTILLAFRDHNPTKDDVHVLGEQLQFLVAKLVVCCTPDDKKGASASAPSSKIVSLLRQLTVDASSSIYDYIRDLEPFPDIACFERIQEFHSELCRPSSPRDHFLKFVSKLGYLPQKLILWSLRTLHTSLLLGKIIQPESNVFDVSQAFNCWTCDPELVCAVWTLVRDSACGETKEISSLVADFISRVGIGDPHRIVFHLPGNALQNGTFSRYGDGICNEAILCNDLGVPEEVLINLVRLLKKYLLDDGVTVVDMTSRTLRGILSTELGQRALLSFNAYERSLISVHSKGVNSQLVEKLLFDCEGKSMSGDLSASALWKTQSKSYEMWICPLVQSLIHFSHDNILRLCEDIVLLKVEVAELLLPSVLVSLSGRRESENDLCQLISMKVEENIFLESNYLIKSIQVWLDALNVLRSYHVAEKAHLFPIPSKLGRSSGFSRKCLPEKSKDAFTSLNVDLLSSSIWKKAYWLSIDYLVVAKAAIHCGSYFTAVMYVEYWCAENFNSLTLGSPDFSTHEALPPHIELLVSAVTQINEPDSIYGIIQTYKVSSQIITHEHEGNWGKALEYYDLLIRKATTGQVDGSSRESYTDYAQGTANSSSSVELKEPGIWKLHKGLMRSLQQIGCSHVLDVYLQGLANQRGDFQQDVDLTELQYEAAWRAGNWDFSLFPVEDAPHLGHRAKNGHFNENLHRYLKHLLAKPGNDPAEPNKDKALPILCLDNFGASFCSSHVEGVFASYVCLRALQEGDCDVFHGKLTDAKEALVISISNASKESAEYINSTIVKLQILDHLGMAWDLRWKPYSQQYEKPHMGFKKTFSEPVTPTISQLEHMNGDWKLILNQTQLHLNLLEPFIAFRHILLQILRCKESTAAHLLESASVLRKGFRLSLAAAAMHEFKLLYDEAENQAISHTFFLGRLEEAKILRAQGQHEMAINLAKYILENYQLAEEASNVYRLVGKWLADSRSSNSRTILEQYLKYSVELAESDKNSDKKCVSRRCQTYFHLARYTDALFKSYEERLTSSEWQAALRLRKHKTRELDALIRRLKSSAKARFFHREDIVFYAFINNEGEKIDYSAKIQELQKQLTMDREEAEKLQDDRDNFLSLALEGYQRCLVLGSKYDIQVVFRLLSLWFNFSSRQNVVSSMLNAVKEVQSHKFIPLVYQIASRMGHSKDGQGPVNFQAVLVSLVKKMAIDHPYHTMFQLLALANGDRVKDKQRSRNSFIVDMDKKLAAEYLLNELSSCHGAIIRQMKQMVDIYIKLAELETKKEETNRRIPLPREIRSIRHLELVPVVTATFPVDPSCQYGEGSFPHFKGLGDSIVVMNGINAPKVVECLGSDGHKYRQLAKSGNDDLRQDAVMEQFFGLVNTFLQGNRGTWKRRLRIRTYKVVPFTPSAGVLEWVDQTIPLGEYLIGSARNGGAHGRYGIGDWSFLQCREHMTREKDKGKAYHKVCENFRPVMHYFFLERFLQPADWFEKRLSYTRSVAASSMVGYIVGLGDRHSMNILIDQSSAEVVHIDLGVAFEQGLMLKTPEQVPFRLTRDIIDGMGVTGVEGVFRRCCEETLAVMRTNKEALLTIVEVFIHDPLYKWALSPLKALQRQKETDEDAESSLEDSQDAYEGNKDAARALFRVKQKLDGYEDGEMRSVRGQVQQLVQDAIDTERLCQMFPGWGAWL